MLTPQFYTFAKEPLPVKYQYQALRLAPSILDGLIGAGDYSYAAIKEEDGWTLIAYDMTRVESFLEEKGLAKHFINKIYFVQQAKEHFKHPISIDEKDAIVTVDNTVVMLPQNIVGVEKLGTFTDDFRPKRGITPSQSRKSWITQKQAVTVSILLLLFAAGYVAEGLHYQNAIVSVEAKIESVKKRYPRLENKSSMVLNNLYESNHLIDSLQRKIRDRLKEISRLASKASKIDTLTIDTKEYKVTIATDKQHILELKKYAKTKKLNVLDANSSLQLKGAL